MIDCNRTALACQGDPQAGEIHSGRKARGQCGALHKPQLRPQPVRAARAVTRPRHQPDPGVPVCRAQHRPHDRAHVRFLFSFCCSSSSLVLLISVVDFLVHLPGTTSPRFFFLFLFSSCCSCSSSSCSAFFPSLCGCWAEHCSHDSAHVCFFFFFLFVFFFPFFLPAFARSCQSTTHVVERVAA